MKIKKKTLSKKFSEYKIAHRNLDAKTSALESHLAKVVHFEFSISYIPGDGFCLLDLENENLANVSHAIEYCEIGKDYTRLVHEGYST